MRCNLLKLALLALPALLGHAQTVEQLARVYRDAGTASSRAALARFAAEHPRDQDGALARFALAAVDLEAGRHEEALALFRQANAGLTDLADFAHYGAAKALIALGRKDEALREFEAVASFAPVSPQANWAILSAGTLLLESGSGEAALRLATRHLKQLPAPQGPFLYGAALEAAGRRDAAAMELYKVFYEYPLSEESRKAEPLLMRLQPGPPVPPALVLKRAEKLMRGGDPRRAVAELQAAMPNFAGADRELATVRLGVAKFYARDLAGAILYLKGLQPAPASEADAERLHFIVQAARRINRYSEVDDAVHQLNQRHRKSPWRMQALSAAANRFLIANDTAGFEPLFSGCAEFAPDPEAALCHWKLTWSHYIRRLGDAPKLLREHVEKFPGSEDAAAALYFQGRLAERDGYLDVAKAHYEAVDRSFPNFYYAVVSRERLRTPALAKTAVSEDAAGNLAGLKLGRASVGADFVMDEPTRLRIRRGRLLNRAAADDWAEAELRFAGRSGGAKVTLCTMELAKFLQARGANGRALRIIKSVPGFLTWRLEDAPKDFWKMAYPLHYRESLERYAEEVSIDPFVVAGLIRQESEFDPAAVSRANARGLTQVLPVTGRDVSRRLGIRNFSVAMLHQPESSLRIGITYLRQMLNSFDSQWFLTLAAYNAGPSRANMWVKWGEFREAPEFIETIPFHETRGYVQTVLRNADLYRRIWAGTPRPTPVAVAAVTPPAPAAAPPPPRPAKAAGSSRTRTTTSAAAAAAASRHKTAARHRPN